MDEIAAFGLTPTAINALCMAYAFHFIVIVVLWLAGRGHKNDSVLDIYWGFSFVVPVWAVFELTTSISTRGRLVVALVTVWGARLDYHLLSRWARIHAMGGDLRYQDIKTRLSGSRGYAIKSLMMVYLPMWQATWSRSSTCYW